MMHHSQTIRTRGFTLIELLVVIAIIGLLSSVVLTSLNVAREHANDSTRKSNLTEVQKALQSYYDDKGTYPAAAGNYNTGSCPGGVGNCATASQCAVGGNVTTNNLMTGLVAGGYIPQLPSDSESNLANSNCCYMYFVNSTGSDYKFSFFKGTAPTGGCALSAAGTNGGPIDPARAGNGWAVYTPGASAY